MVQMIVTKKAISCIFTYQKKIKQFRKKTFEKSRFIRRVKIVYTSKDPLLESSEEIYSSSLM